jgi:RimJ/RimL family protein N-acetyltransferase
MEEIMNIKIVPMTEKYARLIMNWRYEEPYALYNLNEDDDTLSEFLNNSYYSALDEKDNIIGFYCYGESAQVPAGNQNKAYENKAYLDVGLGMCPSICGKGIRLAFLQKGLAFGGATFDKKLFRLTVALFNKRAIKVYEKANFKKQILFELKSIHGNRPFVTMTS